MLTKEIVMSVLVELGSVLPEEEFYDESESLCLVMEYAERGDLEKRIRSK